MEMLCPNCLSGLTSAGQGKVACPACREVYDILFDREAAAAAARPQRLPSWPASSAKGPPAMQTPPLPQSSDKILTQCPACGKQHWVAKAHVGSKAKCGCGAIFQVTPADEAAAALASMTAPPAPQATPMPPAPPSPLAPPGSPPPLPTSPGAPAGCADDGIPFAAEEAPRCPQHPGVAATANCSRCGALVCQTCAFPRADGTVWCPRCAMAPQMPVPWAPPPAFVQPLNVACQRHPAVTAIYLCTTCKAPICGTCAFSFPGGIHLCPSCATSPKKPLSGKRRSLVIGALALATWSTIGMVVMFSGALRETVTESDAQALGIVIGLLVGMPAIIGGGIGISCFDRRLSNPPVVWVAAIWNGILLAVWVLLSIIGVMR